MSIPSQQSGACELKLLSLLLAIAILATLASLTLPAVVRAYRRAQWQIWLAYTIENSRIARAERGDADVDVQMEWYWELMRMR